MADHRYEIAVTWTGNRGPGTTSLTGYDRDHTVSADGLPPIPASADPHFRGDPSRWNPEQLFVASLSQCHLLWYLALCSNAGVVVEEYADRPVGTMVTEHDGSGRFTDVLLRPSVVVAAADQVVPAIELHERAHRMCFVAQSVSCPVRHEPEVVAR